MVAKFQTLMLLIANAESSPLFICTLTPKNSGEITAERCQRKMTGALIFKQNKSRMSEDF
jgi:hypothetical protein